jgi:3-hydroxyisobutyrate dehydrogenase
MKIGYIGLGVMGSAMAANLLSAGFSVSVWNRTASKCESLRGLGADVASSPADLARDCDVICINVTDTPDVEAVLFGEQGIASAARSGLIVIDHSTIRPDKAREFAERLAAQSVVMLDAPVSGGDVGARSGTLSIMVGGDAATFEKCKPIFEAVGKRIVHLGDAGAGQVCKACNQIAVLTTLAGVCEAMVFGAKQGVDLAKMIEVVGSGAGGSWQLANLGPKILAGDLKPAFMIDLALKDLRIVADNAAASGLTLEAVTRAQQYLEEVKAGGGGALGTQAMILALEQRAKIMVAGTSPAA